MSAPPLVLYPWKLRCKVLLRCATASSSVGPGEVIHADVGVSVVLRQLLDDELQNVELGFGAGQGGFLLENFLRRLDPRHVRVTEDRQPVRRQLDDLVQGLLEGFHRLVRQTVNQIQVDGRETRRRAPTRWLARFARAAESDAPPLALSGLKSCTPMEARLNPTSRKAAI